MVWLRKELCSTFTPFKCVNLSWPISSLLFSPAFGYGLLCLGMAYVSSQMGPVLQVRIMQRRKQFIGEKGADRNRKLRETADVKGMV